MTRRLSHNTPLTRITITIPVELVELTDKVAKEDFTTRSGIIRQALLAYIRPLGKGSEDMGTEQMIQLLQNRSARAYFNKIRPTLADYH